MNRAQFSSLIKKGRKKMYNGSGKKTMDKKKTTKTKKTSVYFVN